MSNKIYNFLPAHLRNSELESIFDATLERAFSKGSMRKEKAFIGRREKGIYSEKDVYLSFPEHLFQRDNYGLEPVFSNTAIGDNIFYEDLLNAMFNKGMLTNDHRRLFKSDSNTVNLPIDADKFINWSMYYWVRPGFFPEVGPIFESEEGDPVYPYVVVEADYKHYVTVEKSTGNWWGENNAWYHYEDISDKITSENKHLIEQAKRPIIEFDSRLSIANTVTEWELPTFTCSDGNAYNIFKYITSNLHPYDNELGLSPKLVSNDYNSEYSFIIDLPTGVNLVVDNNETSFYIPCDFNYRNLRHEFGSGTFKSVEITQDAKSQNDIDVYVDGIKQIGNYSYADLVIEFTNPIEGELYVDYTTDDNVVVDGDNVWQRINPAVEYNVDNESFNNRELSYSVVYEHLVRMIETTDGLTGEPNGVNNFRNIGDNADKLRFNNLGSIMVRNSIDIKKAYFSITRDDYDPIKSVEFLSTSYSNYKNKLVTVIRDILDDSGSETKTTTEILEQAISEIALAKRSSISVFDGLSMLNFGEETSHYTSATKDFDLNFADQEIPLSELNLSPVDEFINDNLSVYINGKLQKHIQDYVVSFGSQVNFNNYAGQAGDVIEYRYYTTLSESFIPPSSTKLKINQLYNPEIVTDREYYPDLEMIRGHDGSLTPIWGDKTDAILLEFETLIYNRLVSTATDNQIVAQQYGMYKDANDDYSFSEKKYIQYPFFKKWMIRNNIDNLYNDTFDPDNPKTWNYRAINELSPGHWRGIMKYVYGTDNPVAEPWVTVGFSSKPQGFDMNNGIQYKNPSFWDDLKLSYNKDWPVPIDIDGKIKTMNELFFNSSISNSDVTYMDQDWEFGDGSPVEMAWRRSSEYAFVEFLSMILTKPFEVLDNYADEVDNIIAIHNQREGYLTNSIISQRNQYEFKLGSKLGGFVNNFRLLSENSGLSNSRYTDIPRDNYDLFVHAGEPNRSESFSAIVIEKVSLDKSYPTYDQNDTATYKAGDIILNTQDNKHYKRKTSVETTKEANNTIKFDYSNWTLISQPKTREFGYRVHGYDDFNTVFFAMDWDKTSGEKVWSTDGDEANLKPWTSGEYYRQDSYIVYNSIPYVSLVNHTASTLFDGDIDNWKILAEWPRINQTDAYGYKKTLEDQIKTYSYGDILSSRDEVAHLMIGYQAYLKAIGWDFTDTDEDNQVVDFEKLLEKFLDWSAEVHQPGDFITLTPVLFSGSFETPYGVATIGRETNKNFYRVVDESGRQIPTTEIKFNSDNGKITWESTLPIYGIKLDVADIEQAFVVDRVDSYGDTIYDPFLHNRNLRMLVDCNRTTDWDGTLAADGYIVSKDKLIPNLETMVAETQFYRDTIVDQSLANLNSLKANQIGYSPRDYLRNHGIERESQLEFYKGFLAGKSTVSSINRIINFNSNFDDLTKRDIWAVKLADYGKIGSNFTVTENVNTIDIVSDPHMVDFNNITPIPDLTNYKSTDIKDSGYVDPKDVNYIVESKSVLTSSATPYFEGDTAWVRFDEERDWDVQRLSEIAEIQYISETEDGQLKVTLNQKITTSDTAYLKIVNSNVDPEIEGNYYFVFEEEIESNDLTLYEYIVFDLSFEPLIVEIDSTTDNSVYVPTASEIGVEAIGYISNPTFDNGDTLHIDGKAYTFAPEKTTIPDISIGGDTANPDPIVSPDEQVRIVVYDSNGLIANTNTLVTFSGTNAHADTTVASEKDDEITINGSSLIIDYSATQSIQAESTATTANNLTTGSTLSISSGTNADSVTIKDIEIVGNVANPIISENRKIRVNGVEIEFIVPAPITGTDSEDIHTDVTTPVNSITLDADIDMTDFLLGNITVNNGVGAPQVLTTSDYTYLNGEITFNTPIADAQVMVDNDSDPETPDVAQDQDGLVDITVQLIAQPVTQSLTTQEIVDIVNDSGLSINASLDSNDHLVFSTTDSKIRITGSPLVSDFGMSTSNAIDASKLNTLAQDINALSYMSATMSGDRLVISTTEPTLTLSGSAFNEIGFPSNTYNATSSPTSSSIVTQIQALNIPGVTADVTSGRIRIKSTSTILKIEEVTEGAIGRLGYSSSTSIEESSGKSIIEVTSISSVIADLNTALADLTGTQAIMVDRRVKIISDQNAITLSNISGNAWSDIGISTGTYSNTSTSSSAIKFQSQINEESGGNVEVIISTDGRMIFKSDNNEMSFLNTSQSMLNKIGLYTDYTSVTSNADFKVMRWKSVRFTPNFNGSDFKEFFHNLGLNETSKIWADEYENYGWAVVQYNTNDKSRQIINRAATPVDTSFVDRIVASAGESFYHYQLFDPLNFKISGSISKDIDYVTWSDPALYDIAVNSGLWLEQNLGQIWWDTNSARYYRYSDYGDANGNIDINYAKRFWGKLVPGSEIVIKQWVTSETLPDNILTYNTETYFDNIRNKKITRYYYWTEVGDEPRYTKEYSIEEIRMMIASPTTVNKFFPIDGNTIIISNNSNILSNETISYSMNYRNTANRDTPHSDWELISRTSSSKLNENLLDDFKKSISNSEIKNYSQFELLETPTDGRFVCDWVVADSVNQEHIVVSVNNRFIDNIYTDGNEVVLPIDDISSGDVVRIYHVESYDSWFSDIISARSNFKSVILSVLAERMFASSFPRYKDFIELDYGIFTTNNWYLEDEYSNIERYGYLSNTRDIDMIKLHNDGVSSFKIEFIDGDTQNDLLDDTLPPMGDEYYFPVNNEIRLVHKENAVLDLDFSAAEITVQDSLRLTQNQVNVQLHEFINMLYRYADIDEIKTMFFDMIEYMYTERTHPDWIYKTSYIDLIMYNKPLRQYAIYQRDSYQDTIDYVTETKPYHAKIRKTERIYPKEETLSTDVEALHHMHITKYFGNHSRFELNGIDGGDGFSKYDPLSKGTYQGGKFLRNDFANIYSVDKIEIGKEYLILDLGDTDFTLIGAKLPVEAGKTIFIATDTGSGSGIVLDTKLYNVASEADGFDTGEFSVRALESAIVTVDTFTDDTRTKLDKKEFYVYDRFGRGYHIPVKFTGTISNFDGSIVVVDQETEFQSAKSKTTRLIALENDNGDVEFMLYDKKTSSNLADRWNLAVSERSVYSGISSKFENGDSVHVLGVPDMIYNHLDE
ncbi:hypothetical protein N8344_00065 [bacterium]|nr:hypothetical protein [bacterium]